jgi:hypothetical protein
MGYPSPPPDFLQNPLPKGLSGGVAAKIVILKGLRAKSSFQRAYAPKTEQESQMALLFRCFNSIVPVKRSEEGIPV